jgi:hypothetical protein
METTPFDTAPSYLVRDGDGIYGERITRRIESLGIDEVVTAPASLWQNAYVERVIGTLRRELFELLCQACLCRRECPFYNPVSADQANNGGGRDRDYTPIPGHLAKPANNNEAAGNDRQLTQLDPDVE